MGKFSSFRPFDIAEIYAYHGSIHLDPKNAWYCWTLDGHYRNVNLTYVNMGRYISVNAPQLLEEFEKQKDSAKAQENPYRAVLAWFLEQFPNYDDYKKFFEDKDKTAEATAAEDEAPDSRVIGLASWLTARGKRLWKMHINLW